MNLVFFFCQIFAVISLSSCSHNKDDIWIPWSEKLVCKNWAKLFLLREYWGVNWCQRLMSRSPKNEKTEADDLTSGWFTLPKSPHWWDFKSKFSEGCKCKSECDSLWLWVCLILGENVREFLPSPGSGSAEICPVFSRKLQLSRTPLMVTVKLPFLQSCH